MKRRVLSAILCFAMLLSLFPASVFAEAAELSGTLAIAGTAVFGETLTATVTDTNNTGTLSYQWKRGDTDIAGANTDTYQVVEADIGSTLTVNVTSSVEKGTLSETTAQVTKGTKAAPDVYGVACTAEEDNDGAISGTNMAMEYSTDSTFTEPAGATCGTGTTASLAAGTYYVRYAETTTYFASAATQVTVLAHDAAAADYCCRVTDKNGNPVNAVSGGFTVGTDGKFETLQAAINVVPTSGVEYKITMLAAFEYEGVTLAKTTVGQKIVLDLAGYDLTLKVNADKTSCVIENLADLTLMDSTDTDADGQNCGCVSNEMMDGVHSGGYGGYWQTYNYTTSLFINRGTFTMESGSMHNTGNGSICYGFDNLDNYAGRPVTLNIHGGKIVSDYTAAIRFGNGVPNATFNMDGGWVESATVSSVWLQCLSSSAPKMTMNISGGTLVGYDGTAYGIYDTGNSSNVTYNISGGTFTGNNALYTNGANVNITGGTFNGDVVLKQNYEGTTLHISGGEFDGRVSSYGTYAKTGFIYGGHFNGAKNYDTSSTYYFDEDDLAYYTLNTFTQLDSNSEAELKTPGDYLDAGYILHLKAGVSGYLLDNNGNYVLKDAEGTYWYYDTYETVGEDDDAEYYDVYVDKDGNELHYNDAGYDDLDYVYLKLCQFNVYEDKGGAQGVTMKGVIYAAQADDYYMTDEEKDSYCYSFKEKFIKERFYAAGNYHDATTYATYPNKGKSGGQWGYVFCDNYSTASTLAYSRSYLYSNYLPEQWVSWGWITSTESFNLSNYWKKVYNSEYKGLYTDESTGDVYKEYSFYNEGEVNTVAEGYTEKYVENDTPDYYWVVPCEVNLGKAVTEEQEVAGGGTKTVIKVKGDEIDVDRTNGTQNDSSDDIDAEVAASLISSTLKNELVSGFLDTKINESLGDEEAQNNILKTLLKQDAGDDTVAKENIDATSLELIKTRVDVDLKAATVSEMELASAEATVTTATFDVKPMVRTTVEDSEGNQTQYEAVIPNSEITAPIVFRLPVNSNIISPAVKVYHSADKTDYKKELLGYYPIQQSADGKKFVELSASEFSYYTYEILDVANSSSVAIIDEAGNNRGFTDTRNDDNEITKTALQNALESYLSSGNEDDLQIILLRDVQSIDFDSKEVTINLNGMKLTGTSANAQNVTVVNENESNPETLAAVGTYKNDVSAIVADGYDTKKTTVDNDTVYATTGEGVYTVEVTTETTTDRVKDNGEVDLYAGDYVTVTVKVNGARFVAADVTLSYDKDCFELVEAPSSGWSGDYEHEYMQEDGLTPTGKTRFYNAKSGTGYYEDGCTLGTFLFKAKATDGNRDDVPFAVSTTKTYVSGAWSEGWNSNEANALPTGDITDAAVNIVMKNMTASVTAITGLSYKATGLKLLQDGFTAKDNTTGKDITGASIEYAYVTKTASEDENFNASDLTYTATNPLITDAGDYVIYYNISKAGYVTVSDSVAVSIAKAQTTISWKSDEFVAGKTAGKKDNAGNTVAEDFYKTYSETAAELLTGEYDSLESNAKANATVTVTSKPSASDGTLKAVGTYTLTAEITDNYEILNPTCTVLIDGAIIQGYDLSNTDEGTEVWYDSADHAVAQLVKDTTLVPTEDKVTVEYSLNGGTWQTEIPDVNEVGKYTLTMKITADSYYEFTDTVNFEIKNVQYKVEKTDYVYGWDLVLIYTNDDVPGFTYNTANTYDVTDLGYTYGAIWNAAGTAMTDNGITYDHVYALAVYGDADITLVVPSNTAAITIDRTHTKSRYDVNNNNAVDINDLVAVQGVYNVDDEYFLNADNMSIILRADVSGNKKVDTYDCSMVKFNTGK